MLFRLPSEEELTDKKLNEFIAKHDAECAFRFKRLKDAYETDYQIFHQKPKPNYKPDNRIAVNFAKYMVDTFNGYFIGNPIKISVDGDAAGNIKKYVELLDQYNDQDDNNAELSKICCIYGKGYEMYYVDELGNIGITYLTPFDAFMIYDDSVLCRERYFVRLYIDSNDVLHGSVSDAEKVRWFTQKGNCHCSTAAYMDNEAYEEWINSYQEHGLNFEDWKTSRESEESKKKYKYADTVVKKSLLTSSEYRKKFNQVSGNSKVNRRAWNISKDMLSHRSGTKFEDLAFINVVNGKYAVNKDYDVESKANMNKQMKQLLEESEPETIIAIHNHPGSSVPSLADLMTCVNRGYYFGLVACHDGKVYKYWVDKNKFNSVNAGFALDRMETQGYDKEVRTWLEQAGVYMEVW